VSVLRKLIFTDFNFTKTPAKLEQVVGQEKTENSTLDFPDISQYSPTFQGTQEFCQDLLS